MANHFKLHTDNPIKNSEYDGLGFEEYANVLSKVILNTDTPFTIGIFGEWGKGKTSLMHLIKDKIDTSNNNKSKFITVFFNAWQYENDTDPIIALIVAINEAIEAKKLIDDKIWEGMKDKLSDIATFTKYAMCVFNEIKFKAGTDDLGVEIGLDPSKPFEKFKEAMEEKESEINKLINKNRYYQIFKVLEELEEKLEKENIEIVVFIDDLDRCLPNNAVRLLESIKLVLDLKGFTFVLGVAREVIEGHLEYKYKEEFGIKTGEHGKFYLDKIIQLPFYLPNHSSKMEDISNALYKKLGNNIKIEKPLLEVLECISLLDVVTPRFLVRLINRVKVNIEIIKEKEKRDDHLIFLEIFSISCVLEELYKLEYILLSKNSSKVKYINNRLMNEKFDRKKVTYLSEKEKIFLDELLIKDDAMIEKIFRTTAGEKWLKDEVHRKISFEFLKSSSQVKYKDLEFQDNLIQRNNEVKEKVKKNEINIKDYQNKFIKIKNVSYEFSKYLVTNAWYEEFILSNGYKNETYWITKESQKFRNNISHYSSLDELYNEMCSISQFRIWHRTVLKKELKKEFFNNPLQPIVYISYYEAQAFCEYLNNIPENKEYKFSIPTKEEFLYVGSFENKRIYPWGEEWDYKFCNNRKVNIQGTSIVGIFDEGKSSQGVMDMSGNVWKWTIDNNNKTYISGGSYCNSEYSDFLISSSSSSEPRDRYYYIGFYVIRKKRNTL